MVYRRGAQLAQSVEHATQSWGHDFKSHLGFRDYLNFLKNFKWYV